MAFRQPKAETVERRNREHRRQRAASRESLRQRLANRSAEARRNGEDDIWAEMLAELGKPQ